MVFAGPRHLEPSSATRHHSADRAETVRRLANWSTGRVFQAGRMTTPSGITPSRTSRHRAISSLRARATIMVLRAFGAFSVRWRYHCASALSFWKTGNLHAKSDHATSHTGIARSGHTFLATRGAAPIGRACQPSVARDRGWILATFRRFDDADAALTAGAPFLALAEPALFPLASAPGTFGRAIGKAPGREAQTGNGPHSPWRVRQCVLGVSRPSHSHSR